MQTLDQQTVWDKQKGTKNVDVAESNWSVWDDVAAPNLLIILLNEQSSGERGNLTMPNEIVFSRWYTATQMINSLSMDGKDETKSYSEDLIPYPRRLRLDHE
jgi:hypothetical protein